MKKALLIISIFLSTMTLLAQESYLYGAFSHNGKTLPYRYLEPQNIKSHKKYPVVLFLHGAGERGTDNEAQLLHCSGQFLNPQFQENYPEAPPSPRPRISHIAQITHGTLQP